MTTTISASAIRAGAGPGARGRIAANKQLHDADIRSALVGALVADGCERLATVDTNSPGARDTLSEPPTFLIEEFPLRGGFVRADVVAFHPGALHIYEIKSDCDRLDRLPEQLRLYGEVADYVTLVVGWPHAAEILRGTPNWCEVWLAERARRGYVSFVRLRARRRNPHVVPSAIAAMLSRDEALAFLIRIGAGVGVRSKPRAVLHALIDEAVTRAGLQAPSAVEQLRTHVHEYWFRRERQAEPAPYACDV